MTCITWIVSGSGLDTSHDLPPLLCMEATVLLEQTVIPKEQCTSDVNKLLPWHPKESQHCIKNKRLEGVLSDHCIQIRALVLALNLCREKVGNTRADCMAKP